MNDQLISFEVAKLAKEKGFKEYCENLYNEDGVLFPDLGNYNGIDDLNYISYSVPSQSLLQKWLREVHALDMCIECIGYFYGASLYWPKGSNEASQEFQENDLFDTYEGALEDGLFEALKLINIDHGKESKD